MEPNQTSQAPQPSTSAQSQNFSAAPINQVNPQQENTGTKFKDGWSFFKASLSFLFRNPIFILPLFITWIITCGVILYARYFWAYPNNYFGFFAEIYLFVFVISYSIILGNLMLLELIKQIEDGNGISFFKALKKAASFDAIKAFPIAVFFSVVWFVILIIRAMTSKKKNNESKPQPSLQDAALTLGGISNNPFSWLGLGLSLFEKLLRMTVFLALPAIAWEGKGSWSAFKRAVEIIKTHSVQFLTTYALTGVTTAIMAFPLIPVYLASQAKISLPHIVLILILVYEGLTWSLGIYLEQMTDALLYLWHLKWLQAGGVGDLSSFMKPDLLADFHNLKSYSV